MSHQNMNSKSQETSSLPISLENLIQNEPNSAHLVHRDELLYQIKEYFTQTSEKMSPIVLYGQPMVGKTRILGRLAEILGNQYIPLIITLQGTNVNSLDLFAFDLAQQLSIKFRKWAKNYEVPLNLNSLNLRDFGAGKGTEAFFKHWENLQRATGKKQSVVMIDEIESFLDASEKLLQQQIISFLDDFVNNPKNGYFILVGSEDILYSKDEQLRMLIAQGRATHVHPYNNETVLSVFSALQESFSFADDTLQACLALCDGNPRLLKETVEAAIAQARKSPGKRKLEKDDIDPITSNMIERADGTLLKLWDHLSSEIKAVIWLISQQVSSPFGEVEFTIDELVDLANQYPIELTIDRDGLIRGLTHLEAWAWIEWKHWDDWSFRFKLVALLLWLQRHRIDLDTSAKLLENDWHTTETWELIKSFFESAGFIVRPGIHNFLWIKNNSVEWQDAGIVPVMYFEENQLVKANQVSLLVDTKRDKHSNYAFIVFHARMVDGVIQQLRKLKERNKLIVIPIHIAEIRQALQEVSGRPSPAYQKLITLKRQWSTLIDPYASVNSLTDPQWFFGQHRQAAVQKLLSEITSGINHLVVFGMRRVGKTILLNQLYLACQAQRYIVAIIVCKRMSSEYTYADVLSEIVREWSSTLETLYPDISMPSPSPLVERYSPATASKFKTDIFKLAKAIQQQINQVVKFVLILDEVDHIFPGQESPEETYYQYCNLFQILKSVLESPGQDGIVSMIVAMEYPWIHLIDRFPHNRQFQNPLYRRFQPTSVDFLQRGDWNDMVQTIGVLAGIEYSAEGLDVLYHYSSGHPEITRKLGSCLIELRDDGEIGGFVTAQEVYLALSYFLDHPFEYDYLEITFWGDPLSTDLDTEQRLVLELSEEEKLSRNALLIRVLNSYKEFIEIRTENPPSDEQLNQEKKKLNNALQRLIDLQIITEIITDEQQGLCNISIPLYRDWIRQTILGIEVKYI